MVSNRKRVSFIKLSYNKFFKLLIDEQMMKGELYEKAGININTIRKMAKGHNLHVDTLAKICIALDCTMDDIMELILNE